MSDDTNRMNQPTSEPHQLIDHRCGHQHLHFVDVAKRSEYVAWIEAHDCGLCALSDLQDGVVLDRILPSLLGDDAVLIERMKIFRAEVLADVVDICSQDQRWLGNQFEKWDLAVTSIARRRALNWWADLWADPSFQARYLVEQFANGTPRHPHFPPPAPGPSGIVVSPVLNEPYSPADFGNANEEGKLETYIPDFRDEAIDLDGLHGALLKDLRECWEMVKAGRGAERPINPIPRSAGNYLDMVEYRLVVLEAEYEYLREYLAQL